LAEAAFALPFLGLQLVALRQNLVRQSYELVLEMWSPEVFFTLLQSLGATGFTCKDCLFGDELPHFSFRGWFKIPLTQRRWRILLMPKGEKEVVECKIHDCHFQAK
jgi:hypothetical protein